MSEPYARPLGLQLYTVRRTLDADVEETLAAVAGIGYTTVELAGLHGRSPEGFRDALDAVGLRAVSGHVQFDALGPDWERHLDEANVLEQEYVVCAAAPRDSLRSLDGVRALADTLNGAGEAARRAGLVFAYHNHDFELEAMEGMIPLDLLLVGCDPALVQFELDLDWVRTAGHDPGRYLADYPGRFPLLHVGEAPADVIGADLARATAAGVRYVFVEHDEPPGPALGAAARSFRHLRAAW